MANQGTFCHVFLSFKGETRNKFTCFLYDALRVEGFEAFMDKEDIQAGDEVDSRIQDGIRGSMSAIIVFSKNYAFSAWCLDELLLILERKKTSRYFVMPVFYKVKPADIKHQLKNYGEALEKHKARHNDKVEKWRQALVEAGNILGVHVKGMRNLFIQNFVKLYMEKFSANSPECRLPQGINQADSYNELKSRQGLLSYKILQLKQHSEGDADNQKTENFVEDIAPTVEWLTTFSVAGTISQVIQPPCTPCEPPCKPCQPPCTPCEPPCTPCPPPCKPCQPPCPPCQPPCTPCEPPCRPCKQPCEPC